MVDCSDESRLLMEIAMNIMSQGTVEIDGREFEVSDIDDVVVAMREFFPEISRDQLTNAITEATKRNAKEVDEVTKALREIRSEARTDRGLRNRIDDLLEYLETGVVPVRKTTSKKETVAIYQLRQVRNNLKKWLDTSDPVMKDRLTKKLAQLNKKIASGDIQAKPKDRGKLHQEVQAIQDEIKLAQKTIQDMRAGPKLVSQIESLQKHLDEGSLPEKSSKTAEKRAHDDLREIIKDMRAKLRQSDPAKKERLNNVIDQLEMKVMKTGEISAAIAKLKQSKKGKDFAEKKMIDNEIKELKDQKKVLLIPKPKEFVEESKEIQDLAYRRDLLRNEIRQEVMGFAPVGFWETAGRGADVIRAVMTTGEFSFGLRQGGVYAYSHPVMWTKAMKNAFKAFASGRSLHDINQKIFERENGPLYSASGLVLIQEGMALNNTEEIVMNYWADKAPVVKNFNRAAIAFMNTMRADLFDAGYKSLGRTDKMSYEEAEIWANYINVMSGRGRLGKFEGAALALNRTFFSARYVASRFQMLAGSPIYQNAGKGSGRVRRMIAMEYARLGLGIAAIIGMGLALGFDIEPDPRSPDFMKFKLGQRRLDVLMGHQQVARFLATMLTGATKTSSGNVSPIRERWAFFTEDEVFEADPDLRYGQRDAFRVLADFGRSKLSPHFGLAIDMFTGKKYTGEEINLVNTAGQLGHPMTYGDIYDVMQEDGVPVNTAMSVLAFLGMGLQTYQTREKRRIR